MTDPLLLDAIADSFVENARRDSFNGCAAFTLLRIEADPERLRAALSVLVRDSKITAVFSRVSGNMHIKRLPDLTIDEQLKLLENEPFDAFCLYPTASVVEARISPATWQDRPFSKALLLAEPQLSFRAFDMGALERYVADPRYVVHFADYMGWMSVADDSSRDAQPLERDKVSLQTFGLGFDSQRNPFVVVYLRYLAGLSAEHQQYWKSYLVKDDVRMTEPYSRSSIKGELWENRSVRYAVIEEMRLIRALSKAIWGHSLFRAPPEGDVPKGDVPKGDVPIGLTSFLRPTAENFNRFVMALDKLLSDSIEKKFFKGKGALESDTDGKTVVRNKGTLTLMEEWLFQEFHWENPDEFRKVVIQPLRKVRELRQEPAHRFTKDEFSPKYQEMRKDLLWEVFRSLSNIRATFAKHPSAPNIEVPAWLDNDSIDVF